MVGETLALEKAVASDWGNRVWLEHDPDMVPVRDRHRFRKLLDRIAPPECNRT